MELKIGLFILAIIGFGVGMFHAIKRNETLLRNKELESAKEAVWQVWEKYASEIRGQPDLFSNPRTAVIVEFTSDLYETLGGNPAYEAHLIKLEERLGTCV